MRILTVIIPTLSVAATVDILSELASSDLFPAISDREEEDWDAPPWYFLDDPAGADVAVPASTQPTAKRKHLSTPHFDDELSNGQHKRRAVVWSQSHAVTTAVPSSDDVTATLLDAEVYHGLDLLVANPRISVDEFSHSMRAIYPAIDLAEILPIRSYAISRTRVEMWLHDYIMRHVKSVPMAVMSETAKAEYVRIHGSDQTWANGMVPDWYALCVEPLMNRIPEESQVPCWHVQLGENAMMELSLAQQRRMFASMRDSFKSLSVPTGTPEPVVASSNEPELPPIWNAADFGGSVDSDWWVDSVPTSETITVDSIEPAKTPDAIEVNARSLPVGGVEKWKKRRVPVKTENGIESRTHKLKIFHALAENPDASVDDLLTIAGGVKQKVIDLRHNYRQRMHTWEFLHLFLFEQGAGVGTRAKDVVPLAIPVFASNGVNPPKHLHRIIVDWAHYCIEPLLTWNNTAQTSPPPCSRTGVNGRVLLSRSQQTAFYKFLADEIMTRMPNSPSTNSEIPESAEIAAKSPPIVGRRRASAPDVARLSIKDRMFILDLLIREPTITPADVMTKVISQNARARRDEVRGFWQSVTGRSWLPDWLHQLLLRETALYHENPGAVLALVRQDPRHRRLTMRDELPRLVAEWYQLCIDPLLASVPDPPCILDLRASSEAYVHLSPSQAKALYAMIREEISTQR